MDDIILKHPALIYNYEIETICRPLTKLGITYFAHVNVTKHGEFSGISNNAKFAEHYMRNKYYNADIHLSNRNNLGNYIVWDTIERVGQSEKMHHEAAQFGVMHTFTIVDKKHFHNDFYHFASNINDKSINQVYIENFDLLQLFIKHFNNTIHSFRSSPIAEAYNIKFKIDSKASGYTIRENPRFLSNQTKRTEFLKDLNQIKDKILAKEERILSLSPQQYSCLKLLAEGYSAKKIAEILNLSRRTVENYIFNLRKILKCSNSKELIAAYYTIYK
jgi:DNA-binding CsgD family transcriptional regulator